MRKPPEPRGKVHIDHPTAAGVLDLGNAVYGFMLRNLARAFGEAGDTAAARSALIDAAVDSMRILSPIAELLCHLPASAAHPGLNAGLSFTMQRSNVGFSQQDAAWPLLSERAREIAAASVALARDSDKTLELVGRQLVDIADRLERAAPSGHHATSPARVGASPESAATKSAPAVAAAGAATAGNAAVEIEDARSDKLLLHFEAKRCIHARFCVLGAPQVFLANVKGPWLHPEAMAVDDLTAIARACPSGAITYERLDGGPEESVPPVNLMRVRENGPLAVHADLMLEGRHDAMFRATLCRCGASKNKPFCDGSHLTVPFVASGEPPTRPDKPLEARNGPLAITPTLDGPLEVRGNVEICSGTGRTIARVERTRLCRCGGSSNKPFCDGTHARIGFRAT